MPINPNSVRRSVPASPTSSPTRADLDRFAWLSLLLGAVSGCIAWWLEQPFHVLGLKIEPGMFGAVCFLFSTVALGYFTATAEGNPHASHLYLDEDSSRCHHFDEIPGNMGRLDVSLGDINPASGLPFTDGPDGFDFGGYTYGHGPNRL
ncbi:MAG TPA: hypothetical protein VFA75_05390 [Nevskia sp.]|nr:hypothetical protein [Nevskia sp.]